MNGWIAGVAAGYEYFTFTEIMYRPMQTSTIHILKLNGEKYIEVLRRIMGIRWLKRISNN
jgi:hypothetical protein